MSDVIIRRATETDVPAMAELRERSGWQGGASATWMAHYLKGEHHPREALAPRIAFVAADEQHVVGYIFGHLTRRLDCQLSCNGSWSIPRREAARRRPNFGPTCATGSSPKGHVASASTSRRPICPLVGSTHEWARPSLRRNG
jgi:hypothetical protein